MNNQIKDKLLAINAWITAQYESEEETTPLLREVVCTLEDLIMGKCADTMLSEAGNFYKERGFKVIEAQGHYIIRP